MVVEACLMEHYLKEAHETLAIGMNRIKGASRRGAGGEDEAKI